MRTNLTLAEAPSPPNISKEPDPFDTFNLVMPAQAGIQRLFLIEVKTLDPGQKHAGMTLAGVT